MNIRLAVTCILTERHAAPGAEVVGAGGFTSMVVVPLTDRCQALCDEEVIDMFVLNNTPQVNHYSCV